MATMLSYNTTTPPTGTAGMATGYSSAYGGIPSLPKYTTDTTSTLGTDVQAQMAQNLPGYGTMLNTDTANIQSNLSGQIPADVIAQMQQQAAERGVSTGSPGSDNSNAAYLRALGLTSLQLQNQGHTQLEQAMAATPIQQMQTGTQTQDLSAQQAVYNSAPNPAAAAQQATANANAGMAATGPGKGGYSIVGGGGGSPQSALSSMGYTAPSYANPTGGATTGQYVAQQQQSQSLNPYSGGDWTIGGETTQMDSGGSFTGLDTSTMSQLFDDSYDTGEDYYSGSGWDQYYN